jgi:signal peptidase
MQRIARIGSWTASLATGLAGLALCTFAVLFTLGYRPVAVYSGSMEPELHVGALALVKPVESSEIRVGDVITFNDPRQPGRLITHRVVEVVQRDEGGLAYRTKGDANLNRDPWAISLPGKVGRYSFDIPYVGYALVYVKTREVRTGLILVTSLLLLFGLLRWIWHPSKAPAAAETASRA